MKLKVTATKLAIHHYRKLENIKKLNLKTCIDISNGYENDVLFFIGSYSTFSSD